MTEAEGQGNWENCPKSHEKVEPWYEGTCITQSSWLQQSELYQTINSLNNISYLTDSPVVPEGLAGEVTKQEKYID